MKGRKTKRKAVKIMECLLQLSNYPVEELPAVYAGIVKNILAEENDLTSSTRNTINNLVFEAMANEDVVCEVLDEILEFASDILYDRTKETFFEADDHLWLGTQDEIEAAFC